MLRVCARATAAASPGRAMARRWPEAASPLRPEEGTTMRPSVRVEGSHMHVEAETTVARPRDEVFEYLAHGERLPEYVTDFATVSQASPGEPALGTEYSYKMERGQAEGTFEWTEFEP